MTDSNINVYKAWDLNTRLFHWINFLCVIVLSILGLIMLNKGAIGISGREAGIGLKVLHVMVGYVFTANLIIRLIWGLLSDGHSRWSTLLPGKNFRKELASYKASVAAGRPQTFVGHNPKGRISVLVMVTVLIIIMMTGLIRAGTDIYYPPLGQYFASQVAAEGISPSEILPYDKTGTDAKKLAELKDFKKPIGTVHIYGAYFLWLLILVHLIAVIRADSGGQGTLISSMFTGKKHLLRKPEDI
ncbi:MAG: cytochrome b/b6 domain-containing protein [Gammaproteobacteria bacterium]|nr:cytochrome b/b6 domain-containing protein [Gammaproteobacteria bacterium]